MKLRLLLLTSFTIMKINSEPYLFRKFPKLQLNIAHISICDLPTPIIKVKNFGNYLASENIFVKRDDLTGKSIGDGFRLYGGNKPRKLEFLLADALKKNAKTIITYGCAGSNHALSTAVYSKVLGLKSILMLKDQPSSGVVRHNLLLDNYYNAELKFFPNDEARNLAKDEILKSNKSAYFIPLGGSNSIGALGFVNAALELKNQIELVEIKEPDLIYVATSSCATTTGLLLGIKAAKIKSKIVVVFVEPEKKKNELLLKIKELFINTNKMLHSLDSSFENLEFSENDLVLNKKFCGTEYGLPMPQTTEAIKLFRDTENINLEATYSAKALAAIIDDAKNGDVKDKTILFWNTYCGLDFSNLISENHYKNLPQEFHKYFKENI